MREEKGEWINSDTIGAAIESPDLPLRKFYKEMSQSSLESAPDTQEGTPLTDADHRFVSKHIAVDYRYGIEPRIIDGRRYFEYGIDATANKLVYEGFVLHHTSTSPIENLSDYMQRRDSERKGTFGYHFLVGKDGRIIQTAPLSKRTNHIKSQENRTSQLHLKNNNTLSVSLHGGYEGEGADAVHIPASERQLSAAFSLVFELSKIFDLNISNCWGHGELQNDRMPEEALQLAQRCRKAITIS